MVIAKLPYRTTNVFYDVVPKTLEYFEKVGDTTLRDLMHDMLRLGIVVELGASTNPLRIMPEFGVTEHVCVEPHNVPEDSAAYHPSLKYERTDGIDYLIRLNGFAPIVVSSGVMDGFILPDENYMEQLVRLIYKKTEPGQLTMHTFSSGIEAVFAQVGFEFVYGVNFIHEKQGHHVLTPREVKSGFTSGDSRRLSTIFFRKPN